jgi:hypothetical protein
MTADERRTGPPSGHADLDTLADLHAGVLAGTEAELVREHAAGCQQCAAALAALDAAQDQLRSLPAPAMPAAVAARLDDALADLRGDRPEPAAPPARASEDELALARERRGRRLSRAIGATAAAVVVIAAGGAIASIVRSSSGTSDTASSGAGSAASAPLQPQESGGGLPPKTAGSGSVRTDSGGQAALPAYDRGSLRAALPTIAGQGVRPRTAALDDPARRAACAATIPGPTGSLRGVQRIVYQGRSAYVFVYADGARLTGFVVTEACGDAPGLPATVLDAVS